MPAPLKDKTHASRCVRAQGCRAVICMPLTTPDIKVDAVRRLGGQVELVGETYSETQAHAQARPVLSGFPCPAC